MGLGDEILVTGQARQLQEKDPRPVYVVGKDAGPRWHPLWDSNPRFTKNKHGAQILKNGPGARPYVDYQRSTLGRWAYTSWQAVPGELYLPRLEPQGYVLIEPNLKPRASPNKRWPWEYWQELVRLMPEIDWLQLGAVGTRVLEGVRFQQTDSFKEAAIIASGARAGAVHEGGLHHCLAAWSIEAVVIFGAMLDPVNTGYAFHRNLALNDPDCLGWRIPHEGCEAAMRSIEPEQVVQALKDILNG